MAQGYSKHEANQYSFAVGASEAVLQYLLGGIGKLSKGATGKLASLIGKIDNSLLKLAVNGTFNIMKEGGEEYLQALLEPVYRNIIFGEENKLEPLSEDKIYQFLLGALTAAPSAFGNAETVPLIKNEIINSDVLGVIGNRGVGTGVKENAPVNQTEAESTAINTNPATHTPKEQAIIEEYQSQTDDVLKEKFEQYLDNPRGEFSRHTISAVSSRQAEDASRILGGDFTGYSNAINSNSIVHILNRHGPNGEEDHSLADLNDASRIGYVLENYDTVEEVTYESGDPDLSAEFRTKDNKPAPMLKYSKKVNGTYYVVEAVPESKYKKFWVVSAYMEKATGGTQAPNANDPGNTPNASLASNPAAFNDSIPTSESAVKGVADGAVVSDKSLGELIRRLKADMNAKNNWKTDWDELEQVFFRLGLEMGYGDDLHVSDGQGGELHLSREQIKELSDMYNQGVYQLFREVLREEAPVSLEEFCKIRYDNGDAWQQLKKDFAVVERYEVRGDVPVKLILELDKIAYRNKTGAFDYSKFHGRDRERVKKLTKEGNAAIMELGGKHYFSHSRAEKAGTLVYNSYSGKYPLIGLSANRIFKTKDLGDGKPRHYDTEAKFLEYVASIKTNRLETFTVTILSEKHICESCEFVVEQFKELFPNATVNIISGNPNYGEVNAEGKQGLKTWKYRKD